MDIKPDSKATLAKILITGLILIFCTSWFHFLYELGRVEIVYSYLYYIPIVFGAFFYGIPGGFMVSAFAGLTYSVFVSASGIPYANRELFPGIASFVLIGLLTGLLSSRLERSKYALREEVKRVTGLYKEVNKTYLGAIEALVAAVDEKDHYTKAHSENVTKYAVAIARGMNLSPHQIEVVERAGRLHDLGKIGVHDYILTKPGKLTPEEWEEIKGHSLKSAKILEPLAFLNGVIKTVRHHHEHFNGKGYPNGKAGKEIPLEARILTVADAFDAMTSDRPYRKAMSRDKAIDIFKEESGRQFDPDVVKVFLGLIEKSQI